MGFWMSLMVIGAFLLSACNQSHGGGENSRKCRDLTGLRGAGLKTIENELPSNWVIVPAGPFSFSRPPDMVEQSVAGVDSHVGVYRNDRFELHFDYGRYSGCTENPDELIDGKWAEITDEDRVTEKDDIRYEKFSMVKFMDIGHPEFNLTMFIYGKSAADQAEAKTIFRSIRFE